VVYIINNNCQKPVYWWCYSCHLGTDRFRKLRKLTVSTVWARNLRIFQAQLTTKVTRDLLVSHLTVTGSVKQQV